MLEYAPSVKIPVKNVLCKNTFLLGQGGYARVFYAHTQEYGPVALKDYRRFLGDDGKPDWESFDYEVSALERLYTEKHEHPYIVDVLARGWGGTRPYLVMALMETSLHRWVRDHEYTPDDAVFVIQSVAAGLLYCHLRGVVHCDLKPDNILVSCNPLQIKISDFGSAQFCELGKQPHLPQNAEAGIGEVAKYVLDLTTYSYAPPESLLFTHTSRLPVKVDVWSFGAVAYYVSVGQALFSSTKAVAVLHQQFEVFDVPRDHRNEERYRSGYKQNFGCIQRNVREFSLIETDLMMPFFECSLQMCHEKRWTMSDMLVELPLFEKALPPTTDDEVSTSLSASQIERMVRENTGTASTTSARRNPSKRGRRVVVPETPSPLFDTVVCATTPPPSKRQMCVVTV